MSILVVQSGGPTAVLNATLAGALAGAGSARVLGAVGGFEGLLHGSLVELSGIDAQERERLRHTPGAILGSGRYKPGAGDLEAIRAICLAQGIRRVLWIGGNGSMLSPLALARFPELRVVGVPKTVDNDLCETDHAPGYPSAARYVALAAMDAGADLATMAGFDGVKVLEVMGRNAGWLTAAAFLAPEVTGVAPPLVLLPEVPVDRAALLQAVALTHARYGHCLIVASEGARGADGQLLAAATGLDPLGRPLYGQRGGVGEALCAWIGPELGLPVRYDKPGTLQRGAACAAPHDAAEAFALGEAAVKLALAGETGVMVRLVRTAGTPYRCEIGTVPLEAVAGRERLLPPALQAPEAFCEYAAPLVGELPRFAAFIHRPGRNA